MPQAKKKQTTKTAKKSAPRAAKSKAAKRSYAKRTSGRDQEIMKYHIYAVTALSLIACILLCANVTIMAVL